jgi:CheY-like chemotaxis protein
MSKKELSVLVIDDDKIVRFIHRKVIESLTEFNVTYYEAINGFEAMRTLNSLLIYGRKMPDLILVDLNMPVLDGFGFIEAFQKLNLADIKRTEIVIVSSSENARDLKRSYELGINSFFQKPITKENIESMILEHMAFAA